jgi:hypothetical protein
MKIKAFFAIAAAVAVVLGLIQLRSHNRPNPSEGAQSSANDDLHEPPPQPAVVSAGAVKQPEVTARIQAAKAALRPELPLSTNKLERLTQIREKFQALAAADPAAALQAAKQISDETERETALLALVTQWTHGELRPPRERARTIERYGLEAGLGLELASNPELAVTWVNELTEGPGRLALLQQTAVALAASDPAAAFALGNQLPEAQRREFFDSLFAGWAANDTEAALQWADQLPDSTQQDAALRAIRTEAPVGIGTEVAMKDGNPVVVHLLPGAPAELSGQIHPGDRILALAQGDNSFVNAQGIPLSDLVQMIRGAPGTTLQLQILSADAPPGSAPQTISITRDQIKFKR